MKKLGNTLYILSSDTYVSKDGENLVITQDEKERGRFPIHLMESVVLFTYSGVSTKAMRLCSGNNVPMYFMSPGGMLVSSLCGPMDGNVLLRRSQFRAADDKEVCVRMSREMIRGKISNCIGLIRTFIECHPRSRMKAVLSVAMDDLREGLSSLPASDELSVIRGIEGNAAKIYFRAMDHMITDNKNDFFIHERNRRPPKDRMNALLSFAYSMLANATLSALMSAGLDPYVGFMHTDRSGKPSLALDVMEELRPVIADSFVLHMVNHNRVRSDDFEETEQDGTILNEHGKKAFIKEWQERKRKEILHPILKEEVEMGLLPHIQYKLLADCIRGDIPHYHACLI
ncbi:MAG: CRISPR-associated endonuclease Cas1 [Methanomassiliicoccaceae archaeon]|jgi:CRISPR-associated protein Cas1|nr:CRISPR-associated endonuclease Cas1 [Methanomassiliicoccaceae archaeon]